MEFPPLLAALDDPDPPAPTVIEYVVPGVTNRVPDINPPAPKDCFDDSIDDIAEICRKIDNGTYVWFVVRVEAFKHGILLGFDSLGGCLYENFEQFLEDGSYEDLVFMAIQVAKTNLAKLQEMQHETI
mgnify:CR=1 FL=1